MNPWGQYIKKPLIHLAISLVRLKLTYGQEVFLSAPKSYLKKVQSLDSKAIKLALGIKLHSSTFGACREAGILPFDEIRKLAAVKYVIRGACHTNTEVNLRSDKYFSKRANKNHSLVHC